VFDFWDFKGMGEQALVCMPFVKKNLIVGGVFPTKRIAHGLNRGLCGEYC